MHLLEYNSICAFWAGTFAWLNCDKLWCYLFIVFSFWPKWLNHKTRGHSKPFFFQCTLLSLFKLSFSAYHLFLVVYLFINNKNFLLMIALEALIIYASSRCAFYWYNNILLFFTCIADSYWLASSDKEICLGDCVNGTMHGHLPILNYDYFYPSYIYKGSKVLNAFFAW